jgi:plasmid replication initiation protein
MNIEKLTDRKVFKHSHELNISTLNLTSIALDIFYIIIAQIKNEDTELNTYLIRISDLEDSMKCDNDKYRLNRKLLIGACDLLMEKKVRFTTKDTVESFQWFNKSKIDFSNQTIELELSQYLKEHLINLKKYVKGDLTSFLKLKSTYSKRIYTLACQYKIMGSFELKVSFLNEMLDTPDSIVEKYSSLKQRVLEQSKKDINEFTDLNIDYSEIKTGRSVTSIKFKVTTKQKKESEVKMNTGVKVLDAWLNKTL